MRVSPSSTRSRPTNFGRALLACLPAAVVLGLAFLTGSLDTADTSRAIGRAVGMMIFPALIAAVVLWLIARRRLWQFWKLLVIGSVLVLLLQLLAVAGQMST